MRKLNILLVYIQVYYLSWSKANLHTNEMNVDVLVYFYLKNI